MILRPLILPAITATNDNFDTSNCSVTSAGTNGILATSITLEKETNTTVTITCDIPVTADLSLVKTSEIICDPYNGTNNPKRIPGAIIKYTITVANSSDANATAENVTITDPIQTDMTYIDSAPTDGSNACSSSTITASTTTTSGPGTITATGSDTGGSTITSKTLSMGPDTEASVVFYTTVN